MLSRESSKQTVYACEYRRGRARGKKTPPWPEVRGSFFTIFDGKLLLLGKDGTFYDADEAGGGGGTSEPRPRPRPRPRPLTRVFLRRFFFLIKASPRYTHTSGGVLYGQLLLVVKGGRL